MEPWVDLNVFAAQVADMAKGNVPACIVIGVLLFVLFRRDPKFFVKGVAACVMLLVGVHLVTGMMGGAGGLKENAYGKLIRFMESEAPVSETELD